jgi:hypothetical protein
MTRARIDSLLAAFPKLIPTGTQHTTVETSDVRYVYQPLEDLYIVLITNKASNILQDIDTLHLFARVVSDLCRSAEEREILRNSFEVLGAFDEVVSMGFRENVNLMQVRSVLEMESHEEKIQEIIARVRLHLFPAVYCSVASIRTKRQRLKKNSNVARNNWKCSVVSSSVVRNKAVFPVEVCMVDLVEGLVATLPSRVTRRQSQLLHAPRHPLRLLRVHPRLKVAA